MREGLICCASDPTHDRMEYRDQEACFEVDGVPVFEVWFWHQALNRWFCMTLRPDPRLAEQGVVFFRPSDVVSKHLRDVVQALERGVGVAVSR